MADLQNINLQLDCHSVRLRIERQNEPVYRRAADKVNEKYKTLFAHYPNKPLEELWMLTALYVAVELSQDEREKAVQPFIDKISELNEKLNAINNINEK